MTWCDRSRANRRLASFAAAAAPAKVARAPATGTESLSGKDRLVRPRAARRQVGKAKVGSASAGRGVAAGQTPLLMGGMNSASIEMAKQLLEPLGLEPMQAGGGGANDPNAPKRFVDGGAIGVQMIRGDVSSMGLGTVTRVEGDKLVAFGHPMISRYHARPGIATVLWFRARTSEAQDRYAVSEVGALVNDRQAAIFVSHRARSTFP